MHLQRATLYELRMPLVRRWITSFGEQVDRHVLVLRIEGPGFVGYGEVTAKGKPLYNEECTPAARAVLEEVLIPFILGRRFEHPDEVDAALAPFRGNRMAKAALVNAVWDAYARLQGVPLSTALGGDKQAIASGASIGIQPDVDTLLDVVGRHLDEGYQRIKLKIKPGKDVDVVRQVREHFPDASLMVDANSAYTLADVPTLKRLDAFGLTMIEQPLAWDDIIDHAVLQKQIDTPICLDESIRSTEDARRALDIGACRVINVKVGRIGGLSETRRLDAFCREHGVPLWCGGTLETGIGRATNIALSTLAGFTMPGDVSATRRYYAHDITDPPVDIDANGFVPVPDGLGLGFHVLPDRLDQYAIHRRTFEGEGAHAL